MNSPVGYLSIGIVALLGLAIGLHLVRRRRNPPPSWFRADADAGFPGLAEFASAHGWQGPRTDVSLDLEEVRVVAALAAKPFGSHSQLTDACTGHYRGMGILVANSLLTEPDGAETPVGVVVVTLPYLLPKRVAVHQEPAVAAAIARRDDWALDFASGRLTCVRHEPFATVADLARTLDGLAEVVAAVPADLVARFTVVMPRLPDGRISDPHDSETLENMLEMMTPEERAAFIDQMRGLRRSRPR
jgi:hypothetical protein